MVVFHILTGIWVTQVCAFVKTQQMYTCSFYGILHQTGSVYTDIGLLLMICMLKYLEGNILISAICLEMHEKIR